MIQFLPQSSQRIHKVHKNTAPLYYTEAKSIWKKILGKEHPDYATSVMEIASVLPKMRGQLWYYLPGTEMETDRIGSYLKECNIPHRLYTETQHRVREKYKDAYYWAGFMMMD